MRFLELLFAVIIISLTLTALVKFYRNTTPAQTYQPTNTPVLPQSITYIGPNRRPVIRMPAGQQGR